LEVIFTGPAREPGHHSRNVCIFAEGEVDRSATGSGVSARAAVHHAKGELALNEGIDDRKYSWQHHDVQALERTRFGTHNAVIPEVSGSAFVSSREYYFDPSDPFRSGCIFR